MEAKRFNHHRVNTAKKLLDNAFHTILSLFSLFLRSYELMAVSLNNTSEIQINANFISNTFHDDNSIYQESVFFARFS